MPRAQNPLNDLQVYKARYQNGTHTESRHLSNHFLTEPYKIGAIVNYAMYKKKEDNILSLLTSGVGNVMEVPNREVTWDIYGHAEPVAEIVEAVTGQPGAGGIPFTIKLDDRLFEVTDVLVLYDGTQIRVQQEPWAEGQSWCYSVVKLDPNLPFVDLDNFQLGRRVSKDYSTVEEESRRGGGLHFNTPFQMKNILTTLRKTYKVSRSAATDVMVIELPHPENPSKKTTTWVKYAEWEALRTWVKENERAGMYSLLSGKVGEMDVMGETGRPVFSGAGIRQQIAPANRRYYTNLSYDILDSMLLDLSYVAGRDGGNYKFIALTGYMGLREFDRAIRREMNAGGLTPTAEGKFITGSGYELTLEGHFRHVKFINGVELTVQHFPPYDDYDRNKKLHPVSGKPTESYRFTIMNIGDGGSMIKKVYKKDSADVMWYVAGSVDPINGTAKSMSSRASSIDGYEVNYLSECAYILMDPTSCGELILSI